jgi:hypothetical protein
VRKGRGDAGTTREVGKGRHGEEGRLGLRQPGFVGCQMTGGFDPGKREGNLGDSGLPKGALAASPSPFFPSLNDDLKFNVGVWC